MNLKNVNVRNADFADLPYEDNFFDAVFCFGALVHTLKFNEVFNEFNRVLKPEGILIIDFDNKYGFIRFFIDFFEILISFFDKKTRKRRQENRKIFFPLSEKNVTKLLSDHSFKIKNKFYLGFLPPFKICGRYILKKDLHLKYIKLFMLFDNIFMLKKASTYIYIICSKK